MGQRSYKRNTYDVLLRNYKEKGFEYTLELSKRLLDTIHYQSSEKKEGMGIVFGEVCESVLVFSTMEYIKRHNLKDWFFVKSLILPDIESGNKDFAAELDFVVFTPSMVYMFECKSYKGAKTIVDKGTILRGNKGRSFDVFAQHENHAEAFIKIFNAFRDKSASPTLCYQMAVFSFAQGALNDKREPLYKALLPFVEIENLFDLYDKFRNNPPVWNLKAAREAVQILESNKEKKVQKHLNYVTELNRRRGNSVR